MSKKIEQVNQARLTSMSNPSLMLMDKVNELIDTANEHSRELIRLHARITDLPKEDEMSKKCNHCQGSGVGKPNSSVVPPECPYCSGTGYSPEKDLDVDKLVDSGLLGHKPETLEDVLYKTGKVCCEKCAKALASTVRTWLLSKIPQDEVLPEVPVNFAVLPHEEMANILHKRSKTMGRNQALADIKRNLWV